MTTVDSPLDSAGLWTDALPRQRTRAARIHREGDWSRQYVRFAVLGDAATAFLAGAIGFAARFGAGATPQEKALYTAVVLALPAVWLASMSLSRAYERRFLEVGSEEFRRVATGGLVLTSTIATVSWGIQLDLARGFFGVVLPVALAGTLVQRYTLRKALHRSRTRGANVRSVLAVGHSVGVAAMVRRVHSARYHGLVVTGACVPADSDRAELDLLGVPVWGGLDEVSTLAAKRDVDAVMVLPCPELDGSALRRLGYELENTDAELMVAPAVVEIVGPRVHIRPVCGLPLLHMDRPELTGARRAFKAAFDRSVAAAALAALAIPLGLIALAIVIDSRGSAFYRQERVGLRGKRFTMLKFRTMVPGAERQVIDLTRDAGNAVLFKIRQDPRVTRVGRRLRRYSIDELPQLWNVVRGDMSLVGPRPPLVSEVEQYETDLHRRFMVKPGLTGLWQINGRSDLDWTESMRLDLRYVENWSLAFDFMILWKTAAAVLRGRGAY